MTSDLKRILALPTRPIQSDPPDLTHRYRKPGGTMTLRPIQSAVLAEIAAVGGLLGLLAVGSGKTLPSLLAPVALQARKPVLFIPATMRAQLARDIEEYGAHFTIPFIKIVPYSMLSRGEYTGFLEEYQPDLIIADECDRLRNPDSARTKRVTRYFRAYPDTKFVGLSGTLTARSVKDYAHFAEWAFGVGSPVPLEYAMLETFSNVLDVYGKPTGQDMGMLSPLFQAYGAGTTGSLRDRYRAAFSRRFLAAPGVVSTSTGSIDIPLYIRGRDVAIPPAVSDALTRMADTWESPNGATFELEMHLKQALRRLLCGFYYEWVWPGGVIDYEWLEARSGWATAVGKVVGQNRVGVDSPGLVARAIEEDPVAVRKSGVRGADAVDAWEVWCPLRTRPEPPKRTVWIDKYLARDAWRWLHSTKEPGIVWVSSKAFLDLFRAHGIPTYGAGQEPPRVAHACVMSIAAHGVGKNLQAWSRSLVVAPPPSGKTWEQLLGRTHRPGQAAPDVTYDVYQHHVLCTEALTRAKEDAKYVKATQNVSQKLLTAVYVC